MIDVKTLKIEEKMFLMEEILNSLEQIDSPTWHKDILENRKDFKNKRIYSISEIKNEFSNKNI